MQTSETLHKHVHHISVVRLYVDDVISDGDSKIIKISFKLKSNLNFITSFISCNIHMNAAQPSVKTLYK